MHGCLAPRPAAASPGLLAPLAGPPVHHRCQILDRHKHQLDTFSPPFDQCLRFPQQYRSSQARCCLQPQDALRCSDIRLHLDTKTSVAASSLEH